MGKLWIWVVVIVVLVILGFFIFGGGGDDGGQAEDGTGTSIEEIDESEFADLNTGDDVFDEIDSALDVLG